MEIDAGELKTLILAIYSIEASTERTADRLADVLEVLERLERKLDAGDK
jgi:hypothetical protein